MAVRALLGQRIGAELRRVRGHFGHATKGGSLPQSFAPV